MRFIRALTLVALALLLLAPTAAQAAPTDTVRAKYGTGYFTVGDVTLPAAGGCFDHPHRLDVNLGYETDGWFVAVNVNGPNGWVDGWISDTYFDDWGASYFEESAFICSSLDGPGAYTITGTLYSINNGGSVVAEQPLTPAYFTVHPYPVAPPPPPAPPVVIPPPPAPPVVTEVEVIGKVTSTRIKRGAKLTFKTRALQAGEVTGKKMMWTVTLDGKVRKAFSQGPAAKRVIKVTSKTRGQHVIRVLRNGKLAKTVRFRA